MSVSYVPIMAAKRGELKALSKLRDSAAKKTIPLFELPSQKPGTKLLEPAIDRTVRAAGKAWPNRPAFIDISRWSPNSRTESGVHVLEYVFSQLRYNSIAAHPVIGYDRWDDPQYAQALTNIRASYSTTPCIRLDREAIEDDMLDEEYFTNRLNAIMAGLDLVPENCFVMLDFGDVLTSPIPDLISKAESSVALLRTLGLNVVVVAGGSMPAGVNEAVGSPDAEGFVPRVEMMLWKALIAATPDCGIVFGDYLIRNAIATEGVISPHANAKIRYTVQNQFFIARGHSKQWDSLKVQHQALAQKLVGTSHFMGGPFSWGDSELLNCSIGITEVRDATGMIALDSNHHINAVIAEVFEQHSLTSATVLKMPMVTM